MPENRPPLEIPQMPTGQAPEQAERRPIGGMPEDYGGTQTSVERRGWRAPRVVTRTGPRYWTGDEWLPGGWPTERITELQADLAAAGFIDKNDVVTWGAWDPNSARAYRNLLEYANGIGVDREQALDIYALSAAEQEQAAREPLVTRLSNPADLRSVFKRAATELAGEVDDDRVERMVQAYQAQEAGAQQQMHQATGAGAPGGPGGTIVEPPSAEAFAEDTLRREQPVETGAVDVLNQAKAAMSWLGFE